MTITSKLIRCAGNIIVPFTIGYLLSAAIPFNNWRFWAIMVLVILYRGTRVEKIDG